MTNKEAIEIIRHECYIFNMGDLDLTTLVNTALDCAVNALKREMEREKMEVKTDDSM